MIFSQSPASCWAFIYDYYQRCVAINLPGLSGDFMKLATLTIAVIFVGLQHQLWLGKNGLVTYRQLYGQIKQQHIDNQILKERNRRLYHEVDDLKEGLEAVESLARRELGWIKQGETFYRIFPGQTNQKNTH